MIVNAYRELTQYVSVSNGCLVAEGVRDGLTGMAVSVAVVTSVEVGEDVAHQQYEGGWIFRELLGLGLSGPIDLPAVTLTATPTPSNTPGPSNTPTIAPSPTLTPTEVPSPTETATDIPQPTDTPEPTNTP